MFEYIASGDVVYCEEEVCNIHNDVNPLPFAGNIRNEHAKNPN